MNAIATIHDKDVRAFDHQAEKPLKRPQSKEAETCAIASLASHKL